jgi:prepilin-type N-terminal cleavage/methylation domain-containing protein
MKTRGFTLIEILLVVFLIALMAITAITSYMNSTTTFKFLSSYQQVVSALRTARSYALSNKQVGDVMPKRYGVCIGNDGYIAFADSGQVGYKLDLLNPNAADKILASACYNNFSVYSADVSGDQDTLLRDKASNIDTQGYIMIFTGPADFSYGLAIPPIIVFYESGSGNLTVIDGNGVKIPKATVPYIKIKFQQTSGSLARYIRIYQVSGLVEESTT